VVGADPEQSAFNDIQSRPYGPDQLINAYRHIPAHPGLLKQQT
jgi:hypothetical protein